MSESKELISVLADAFCAAPRDDARKLGRSRNLFMRRRFCSRLFLSVIFAAALASAASAHPHVWVSAQEQVIFGAKGQIEAIRHAWVFDEMYSAFVTQGQSKDGKLMTKEELAPLAKTNVEDLAEFEFFTHAKAANAKVEFGDPTDYSLEERDDKLVVLRFTLPLKTPASASKAFSLQVYDPTYFVAFELANKDPVSFVGAPKGCSANVMGAKPLAADETKKLSESFFSGLSPGTDFGIKLATPIIIACP
ncbi:DUF1007 family protein [Methylocapsa polymorpha]|uniref:DUF1007 family protein n=1 Tax=Methylocapsa polymorpha TaxID=3080828 RepID=A0ABZ0HYE0_9HYPH|nr:DUF1007 family protein [Methylocapsa sp. RX1]